MDFKELSSNGSNQWVQKENHRKIWMKFTLACPLGLVEHENPEGSKECNVSKMI